MEEVSYIKHVHNDFTHRASHARGASRAVDVLRRTLWRVKVHDVLHELEVNATRRDVSTHKHAAALLSECGNSIRADLII